MKKSVKFDISRIYTSIFDKRKCLMLPEELTPELAEDVGIMVGDGNITIYETKEKIDYEIGVSGHIITDKLFLKNYVKNLKFKLFNLNFMFSERTSINTCRLRAYSKGLLNFYHGILGLPVGSKENIRVPEIVMNSNKNIKINFLRGLVDTDFTFTFKKRHKNVLYYPTIKIATSSKNLILDVQKLLLNVGFKPVIYCNMQRIHPKTKRLFATHQLELSGKKNLEKWVKEVGFRNPKNILKYSIWKTNGFCLPNTEIERIMSGPEGIRIRGI